MKKTTLIILSTILCFFAMVSIVSAQSNELIIKLSRDFGYGGFNGDIQGTFSIKAEGPADLMRVEFFLDETLLGEDSSAPFAIQFVTDNYPTGTHALRAVGHTTDGTTLNSQSINAIFVSKEEGKSAVLGFIVPVLVVVFGAMLLAAIVPIISGKRGKKLPPGSHRSYTFGGGICPKCHRPFGFQLFSMNMIAGKLTPCPHCGKWSIVRRASLSELQNAEQAEIVIESGQIPEISEEERLKKGLDDSRYQNL